VSGARAWPALSLAVCLALCGCGSASSSDAETPVGPLRWAPPQLSDPLQVDLGDGYTETHLDPTQDAVINLPDTVKRGGVTIDGGHDVVLVGGAIAIPADTEPGAANDAQRRGIYIRGATGTVHVEGVLITGSGTTEFDGVDINAPRATVQLENLRIGGVHGRFGAFHGDVVQPWGGVRRLRIDRLTGSSNYQGLTLKEDLGPVGSANLSNVDLAGTTEPPLDQGGYLIWLTAGSESCDAFPVRLRNVFVRPRAGRSLGRSVWPGRDSGLPCAARGAGLATWPRLPVTGGVRKGSPRGGSFVPFASVGSGYSSPGYSH
jgi:hypothetical protein